MVGVGLVGGVGGRARSRFGVGVEGSRAGGWGW